MSDENNLEDKDIRSLEQEIEQLTNSLKEAEIKASENWDIMLRAKAESENIRRRSQLDVEKAHKYSIESFAKDLLHVLDSLDKGLEFEVKDGGEQLEAMFCGLQLTHKLFIDTLEKFGIKEINPIGEDFDPTKHEAISIQETNEVEPNKVLLVAQKGFSIHDRILRSARVVVAKAVPVVEQKTDE